LQLEHAIVFAVGSVTCWTVPQAEQVTWAIAG
jgi:hypothetical protein